MSTSLEKTPLGFDGHPDENDLLLALERELSPEDASRIDRHLGSCWNCRARSHELERGILAFVEYREKRYLPSLETPPQHFSDFPRQLRIAAGEVKRDRGPVTIFRRVSARFARPTQFRWAAAIAAMLVLVILWTQVLNPTPLSANDLLTRAEAFQNPKASKEKGHGPRKAHQKVRISDGRHPAVVRDFEWSVGSKIAPARWESQPDPSMWKAPLTAEGFANWRNAASRREDTVTRSGELWTLDTTAANHGIQRAWLVIRANDYHPVEQHIVFADNQRLDFEELSFEIRAEESAKRAAEPVQIAQNTTSRTPAVGPDVPANLAEVELAVRFLMFSNHWDLDEDLQISRSAAQVVVSGTASSPDRAEAMQTALGKLANVRSAITAPALAPGTSQRPAASGPSPAKTTSGLSTPLLRDILDRSFASSDDHRAFVDHSLTASDTALSHAWVLKKLVDRYGEQEESNLTVESRTRLIEMLRTHLQQLQSANTALDPLVELLPPSPVAAPSPAGSWRSAILALFNEVQRQDSLVAALVVGTQTNGQDVRTASRNMRNAHHAVQVFEQSLREGTTAIK